MITVEASLAFSYSDLPRYLPTTADAPMPRPMARLMMVNVTGKVKLMAVSASVPRKLMNRVSTRLNVNSMSMPIIIGVVMRIRDFSMEPSDRLKLCLLLVEDI